MARPSSLTSVEQIRLTANAWGITRLCHFTPMTNFLQIVRGEGVASTAQLKAQQRAVFDQQDLDRLDQYENYISCSVQYPNSYYMARKREETVRRSSMFGEWVCILIRADHLWREDTLFCPHNAAGWRGANVQAGFETFEGMFAAAVEAPRRTWVRRGHPRNCPTDAQAEVLVNRFIPIDDIVGIAAPSRERAGTTYASLDQLNAPVARLPIVVAPLFWQPSPLAASLRQGRVPVEETWHPAHSEHDDGIADWHV